jgi:hypothetical protein
MNFLPVTDLTATGKSVLISPDAEEISSTAEDVSGTANLMLPLSVVTK